MLVFCWNQQRRDEKRFNTFIWHCSFLLYPALPFIQLLCSGSNFARFLFTLSFLLFSFSPHPLGCIHAPPSVLLLFSIFSSLAPHGMLSLRVQEGDVLKTLTDNQTLRERKSSAAQSMQASSRQPSGASVDTQVWTCQDKGRQFWIGHFQQYCMSFHFVCRLFIFEKTMNKSNGYT